MSLSARSHSAIAIFDTKNRYAQTLGGWQICAFQCILYFKKTDTLIRSKIDKNSLLNVYTSVAFLPTRNSCLKRPVCTRPKWVQCVQFFLIFQQRHIQSILTFSPQARAYIFSLITTHALSVMNELTKQTNIWLLMQL